MSFLYIFLTYCRKHRLQSHVFFWMGILMLSISTNYFAYKIWSFSVALIYAVALLITQIPTTYLLAYFVIPRIAATRKFISVLLLWLVAVYILCVLSRIIEVYGAQPLIMKYTDYFVAKFLRRDSIPEICTDSYELLKMYFYHLFPIPFVFLTVKLLKNQNEMQERAFALEKEKISAELKLLKARLNPHFLFNTLNNIYSLSIENSSNTSDSIFRLAEMLDYILHRSNCSFVSLKEEAHLIENYCALERLRYDDRLQLTIAMNIDEDVEMAPLILVSIVENAFKHGAGEDTGNPSIKVSLKGTSHIIQFEVINSIAPATRAENKERIGLNNIKQQLELIYPNQYSLNIVRDMSYFKVHLEIQLN
jgi:hypothetical protein